MERLSEISITELQQTLDTVDRKKPAQRLIAAIAYKNGVSQTELAEWFDVQRRTIYGWFKRLEDEPLPEAIYEDHRTGRPRKLSDSQQTQLREILHESPDAVGYDGATWTPALVQQYLQREFDVAYSRPSCRRLMKEAGLRYRQSDQLATDRSTDETQSETDRTGRWIAE